jgi:rubrerythrin
VWSGHEYDEKKNKEGYNVIDRFLCIICGHEWTPLYPDGTKQLECPSCGYLNQITTL